MAISHSIILRHGGLLTVKSEPGKRTVFSIYLMASANQVPDSSRYKTNVIPQEHWKIMVMDDDEMVRNIAQAMLTRLGYGTELAADGKEAIAIYKRDMSTDTQVDIIIMDLTIPGGMGGEEAVKEVLAIDPDAKTLVSSGYSNDPIMANYKDYGFSGAIGKPYQMQELNKVIREVLE